MRPSIRRTRNRVRLTAQDWAVIHRALKFHRGGTDGFAGCDLVAAWRIERKIGADGMAARDRGVAAVRKVRRHA